MRSERTAKRDEKREIRKESGEKIEYKNKWI